MLVSGVDHNVKKVSFKGMENTRNEKGRDSIDFFLPYDDKKFQAYVDFVPVIKKGSEYSVDPHSELQSYKIENRTPIAINPSRIALDNQTFAYRFRLAPKDEAGKEIAGAKALYHTDSGLRAIKKDSPEGERFTLVFRDRAKVTNPGGQIIHLMIDSHNPGVSMKNNKEEKNKEAIKKAREGKRNHFNQYGGTVDGVIADIPRLKEMGYSFVLATPNGLIGQDKRSSHGYWTSNPFQGPERGVKVLAKELYKEDIGLILDGAFVNEGMEGYRLQHIQKWGEKSPYINNFKIVDKMAIKNLPNVDPTTKEGKELYSHIKLNIVNANKKYSFNNSDISTEKNTRDSKQYTIVQIYDDRLLSNKQKEQVGNNVILDSYGEHTTGNHYEITNDNHSVLLREFVIPEDEVKDFEDRIAKNQNLYENDRQKFLKTVLDFKNYSIDTHANGFETWDGNADIAKLRYVYSAADEQNLSLKGITKEQKREIQSGAYQNQDHIQQVGAYWTKTVKNTLVEHTAKTFKQVQTGAPGYEEILKNSNGQLPERALEVMKNDDMKIDVIQNVLKDKYDIPELNTTSNVKVRLAQDLINLPLETIGFAPDLTAVLGSPFISKKAFTKEDIGKSRYDFYQEQGYKEMPDRFSKMYNEADEFYMATDNSVVEFANEMIRKADTGHKLIDKENQLTPMGKLMLPLIAEDIHKFAVVKALAPQVKVESKDGELIFDEKALSKINLKSIGEEGISAGSPDEEAAETLKAMRHGLGRIPQNDQKILIKNIADRIEGLDENKLKMAYVVVDRTASGLNWRTDATKDNAPIGEVRDGIENFTSAMEESMAFWKGFADGIKEINPNSYIIAEMTDTDELMKQSGDITGKYKNNMALESAFVAATGVSGLSNYNYTYSTPLAIVAGIKSDAAGSDGTNIEGFKNNLIGNQPGWHGNEGLFFGYPQDQVKTSHNFTANHDKPRLLSILALDNNLFHGGDKSEGYVKEYTPNYFAEGKTPSYKALAMAKAIDHNLGKEAYELGIAEDQKEALKIALHDLAEGSFLGTKFNPDAFGVAPIEVAINDVFKQAKYIRQEGAISPNKEKAVKEGKFVKYNLAEDKENDLSGKTFEAILKPALDKMLMMDEILSVMPGRSTSYSGDEYGATGYETPSKNIYAQNRNVAHREWVKVEEGEEGKIKDFLKDYYDKKQKINERRKYNKTDKSLSPLSNGETAMLSTGNANVMAMFRYNKLSELICLVHSPEAGSLSKIDLDKEEKNQNGAIVAGLAGGLAVGTCFKDIKEKGDAIFGVCEEYGRKTLRKFSSMDEYKKYVPNQSGNFIESFELAKRSTTTILKKIPFKGSHGLGQNQNHIKIQAYLNSKQYLNTNNRQKAI